MVQATLADIAFDKEDALLFSYSDDLLLKAKAIQNSILPKLQVLLQESLALIRKLYGIEVFDEGSTLSKYPSFRENRTNELKRDYTSAFVGLSGNRLPIWKKLKRSDKNPVKILPFQYGYELTENNLNIILAFSSYIDLSFFSYMKLMSGISKRIEIISAICNKYGFQMVLPVSEKNLFSPLKKQIKSILWNWQFQIVKHFSLPTDQTEMNNLPLYFAALFPVYDVLLRKAKGDKNRFDELLVKLQKYTCSLPENADSKPNILLDDSAIKQNAEKKIDGIGIRASIRWQVFERDDFRCVACGATALDGAILHVDHILPRSKGGTDTMENFQTLCQTCNIGKSNKSERNLRERG